MLTDEEHCALCGLGTITFQENTSLKEAFVAVKALQRILRFGIAWKFDGIEFYMYRTDTLDDIEDMYKRAKANGDTRATTSPRRELEARIAISKILGLPPDDIEVKSNRSRRSK